MEILQLQHIDKVVDFFVQVLQFSRADVERQPSSHSCSLLNSGLVVACPLCATTGAVCSMTWRSSSMVLDVPVTMQRREL